GSYTFKGTPNHEFQGLFDHLADSGERPDWVSCESGGAIYNSKWIPSKGAWVMHFGMSDLEAATNQALFTSKGFERTSSYTCGSVNVAVWRKK
ncbi:MAG TPA: hypothetical protein VII86_04070, partial [Thermoanaerobaculia bacterium]